MLVVEEVIEIVLARSAPHPSGCLYEWSTAAVGKRERCFERKQTYVDGEGFLALLLFFARRGPLFQSTEVNKLKIKLSKVFLFLLLRSRLFLLAGIRTI